MKAFFKELFISFLGLTSLYLGNIQPDSKFHPPPPKFSGSAPECEIKFFFRIPPVKHAGCASALDFLCWLVAKLVDLRKVCWFA